MNLTPPTAPPRLADASLIWPPYFVLVIAAVIAGVLASALARSLAGDWFSMERLGYAAGAIGYGIYAASFLWLDARVARHLPNATWPSRRSMWRRTVANALLAVPAMLVAAAVGGGLLSGLAQDRSPALGGVMVFALVAIAAGLLSGAVANARARRRTRIDPTNVGRNVAGIWLFLPLWMLAARAAEGAPPAKPLRFSCADALADGTLIDTSQERSLAAIAAGLRWKGDDPRAATSPQSPRRSSRPGTDRSGAASRRWPSRPTTARAKRSSYEGAAARPRSGSSGEAPQQIRAVASAGTKSSRCAPEPCARWIPATTRGCASRAAASNHGQLNGRATRARG